MSSWKPLGSPKSNTLVGSLLLLPPSILCDIIWLDMVVKKKEDFLNCGLKQFLDGCVIVNHFIKDKKRILKLNVFNCNKLIFFLGWIKKEKMSREIGRRKYYFSKITLIVSFFLSANFVLYCSGQHCIGSLEMVKKDFR